MTGKHAVRYESIQQRLVMCSAPYESNIVPGHPDCWIWMLTCRLNRRGVPYPSVTIYDPVTKTNRPRFAHRVSLQVFKGVVFKPREVDMHKCNITLCINPDHLEGGTQSENMKQMYRQGRFPRRKKRS